MVTTQLGKLHKKPHLATPETGTPHAGYYTLLRGPRKRHFNNIQQIEQIKPISHAFIECIHTPYYRHDLRVGARAALLQFGRSNSIWSLSAPVGSTSAGCPINWFRNKPANSSRRQLEGEIELEYAAALFPVSTVYRL